ncbi:hypothetical protein [Uliginosibacterium sp. H1]|uniref:hypothetical protein n=1 Tax=Uliginosibacterium sp. H1 TaxID=3114757 RepID=UPI002E1941E7|nr:hypothetical protein [Uliginosibacterium sp. H1]
MNQSYKGFLIQPLVFPRTSSERRCREKQYDVAVRITRDDDSNDVGDVFQVPLSASFEYLGDARRAGAAYALRVIDGKVPGARITPASERPVVVPPPAAVEEAAPPPAKPKRRSKVAAADKVEAL